MIRSGKIFKGTWPNYRINQCRNGIYRPLTTKSTTLAPVSNHSKDDEESIVISGISGRYPKSDSLEELRQNLLNGVDMVSDQTRWKVGDKVPKRYGFIKNMDKFDADFFGINSKLAEAMDPQQRKLLEVTFEAIVDAGLNPEHLRGSKTGVYVGTLGGEAFDYWLVKGGNEALDGYGAMGIPNFMMANRLSFSFDLKGPSMVVSTGCSASLVALEAAVQAIRSGSSDSAVVAGATIHVDPGASYDLHFLKALSPDGKCKAFDDAANGYVRSEAIVSMLVQKKKNAKRIYATVKHIKSGSDGYKSEGLVFPSMKSQESLLRETYEEAGVDPVTVSYFEAHGTGTPAGDPQELQAISNVLCQVPSRKEPLFIGSVKSNLGHAESAAGATSLSKAIISITEGIIPANLHFNQPNSYVKHLFDDTLQVVKENTPLKDGLIGISAFGLGGSNVHCILEPGPRTAPSVEELELPVLLPFSGRTEESVEDSLKAICEQASNAQFRGLIHNVFEKDIKGHGFRGYGIVRTGEDEHIVQVQATEPGTHPVWIIFPGMGSQWNEMGKDLLKINAFAESLEKSKITLKNAGLDLDYLLRPGNPTIFKNIRDSLVSITAIQIALYDTLTSLGLKPDGFIGHSSGEILCAYADGCLSAEEALLVGDARGRAFQESSKFPGGMAAIGLSWSEIQSRCPPGLYPACNNVANNVSVSGELEAVRRFVKELQQEGIFAKEINSCNCAPHSPYVYPAMDLLFKYMNEIYHDDRPRTSRWISSSIPESDWGTLLAKTSSPAYHVYNMGNPVLFHEALGHIPDNAVVIEVAPHGMFQALLREALPNAVLAAPMHSMVEDKLSYFLSNVGKIYNAGVDVKFGNLYPGVRFPASANTPPLSPFVKWDHGKSWLVPIISNPYLYSSGTQTSINMAEKAHSFLAGHKLDDTVLFPATGYLHLAWKSFAAAQGLDHEKVPICFENVTFERATVLTEDNPTDFSFSYLKGTGAFEISADGATVVKGVLKSPDNIHGEMYNVSPVEITGEPERLNLKSEDIYKELRLRGYNYTGAFRGIQTIDNEGKWAKVAWNGNWISFLDAVLQTTSLQTLSRNTAVPIRIEQVTIDPIGFLQHMSNSADSSTHVSIYPELNAVKCPGIEIRGMTPKAVPRTRQAETLSLEEYKFSPNFDTNNQPSTSFHTALAGLVDLIFENTPNTSSKLHIVDIFSNAENSVSGSVSKIVSTKPRFQTDLTLMSLSKEIELMHEKVKGIGSLITKESAEELVPDREYDLVFTDSRSSLQSVFSSLKENGYIVFQSEEVREVEVPSGVVQLCQKIFDTGSLSLFKKRPASAGSSVLAIDVDKDYNWLSALQSALKRETRIYLTSQNDPSSGIVGLVKCLILEPGGEKIRCIFDAEGHIDLDFANPTGKLKEILEQDMVMNVVQNGSVGSYRHFPLSADSLAPSKNVEHAYINTLLTGDLSSLSWIESPLNLFCDKQSNLCTVSCASLNPRDISLARGELPLDAKTGEHFMGMEFSGVDPQGKRVMGMTTSKALASSVLPNPEFTWEVPETWSLEDAATVPIPYVTAFYALMNRARLRQGQSVLIHSGSGCVGQAAISIALDKNCQVFTTVETEEERNWIQRLFPRLQVKNVLNSQDSSFEPQILQLTSGRGVDMVLNSLPDKKLEASLRCLRDHGKFVQVGGFDSLSSSVGLLASGTLKSVGFTRVSLNQIFTESAQEKKNLQEHLLDGIRRGVVRPLARTVFSAEQVQDAFKYMGQGEGTGKVLVQVQNVDNVTNERLDNKKEPRIKAVARSYFNPLKSYVIIGGLGGLGLEVANFLVERGARHVVLVSRSGVTNGYQDLCIRKWAEARVQVDAPRADLSSFATAEDFIRNLTQEGKCIGGVFNSGLVLKDAPIEDQTKEMFEAVAAPKNDVTQHLDKLTREYCKDLDYFVVFSSAASGRGNAGQSNYGYANSAMERICEQRQQDGLHGLAIQWGLIGEAGFVAEKLQRGKNMTGEEVFEGTVPQRISSCLEVLDLALQQNMTVLTSTVLADKAKKPMKRNGLIATLSNTFGLKNLDTITPSTPLTSLGMDSLVGMELKLMLERDYDLQLTPNELRKMIFADLLAIDAGNFVKGMPGKGEGGLLGSVFKQMTDSMIKLNTTDSDASPIFLVHGLEGHSENFLALSSKLRCDVYGFQFTNPDNVANVSDLARLYIQDLKSVQPEGPYNIAGYSSGAAIAYEMAMQLQNDYNDQVDNVIVVDGCFSWKALESMGTKDILKLVLETSKSVLSFNEEDEKNFLDQVHKEDMKANEDLLVKWVEKIHPLAGGAVVKSYIRRLFKLGQLVREYEPCQKFEGKAHLIKATEKSFLMVGVRDENHYMEQYCKNPVSVHTVNGNHYTILDPENISPTADIMNEIACKK